MYRRQLLSLFLSGRIPGIYTRCNNGKQWGIPRRYSVGKSQQKWETCIYAFTACLVYVHDALCNRVPARLLVFHTNRVYVDRVVEGAVEHE